MLRTSRASPATMSSQGAHPHSFAVGAKDHEGRPHVSIPKSLRLENAATQRIIGQSQNLSLKALRKCSVVQRERKEKRERRRKKEEEEGEGPRQANSGMQTAGSLVKLPGLTGAF